MNTFQKDLDIVSRFVDQTEEEMTRLEKRIFLLVGWGRWLSSRAPYHHDQQRELLRLRGRLMMDSKLATCSGYSGSWGIMVADDVLALEYQRLEYRLTRARTVFYGDMSKAEVKRAHLARQVANDVRLFLRPPGQEGELWDDTFQWWNAPVKCCAVQNMDDGSWEMLGLDPCEDRN